MTDNIIVLGPWYENGREEWMITRYDELDETKNMVEVTVEGEAVRYAVTDQAVTLAEQASGKAAQLIDNFHESDYIKTMEVEVTRSGSIRVSGV